MSGVGGKWALALVALVAAGASSAAWGRGDKAKEPVETVVESQDARAALDAVASKLEEQSWAEAFDAANELVTKFQDRLVLAEAAEATKGKKATGLHLPAGRALRRKLAQLPKAALEALKKRYDASWAGVFQKALETRDTALFEELADRFFPLREGAQALGEAARLYDGRGDLVAAWVARRDVLELHTDATARKAAAIGLCVLAKRLNDASAARTVERLMKDAPLAWTPDERARVEGLEADLGKLEDADVTPCTFDSSGGVETATTARPPAEVGKRIDLPDAIKALDWRHETDAQREQFQLPNLRRLLVGHAATRSTLLIHVGRAICGFDAETGERSWSVGGLKNLGAFYESLIQSTALPRYGIAIEGSTAFATLRAKSKGEEPAFPQGRVVAIDLREGEEGATLWDSQRAADDEGKPRKKKKPEKGDKKDKGDKADKSDDDGETPLRLSYVGRPVVSGTRVFVGAWNLESPSETYVAALDRETGKLLWKRALASSEAFAAADKNVQWLAAFPRALPAPTFAICRGALVALSGNGCVAALDPDTGRFLWAQAYDRDEFAQEQQWRRTPREDAIALGHAPNAPLAAGDAVFVLPADSGKMFVFRLSDGALLGRHGRSGYEYVLGAAKDTIVVQGDSEVAGYQLAWGKSSVTLEGVWSTSLHHGKAAGRGAVVGKWAYVPLEKGLVAFRVADGERREALTWESPRREAGDLVVGGGRLATVSARYAHTYKEEP